MAGKTQLPCSDGYINFPGTKSRTLALNTVEGVIAYIYM